MIYMLKQWYYFAYTRMILTYHECCVTRQHLESITNIHSNFMACKDFILSWNMFVMVV